MGETRKVGEERRGGKAERQWGRQKVTQKGGGEKERKGERENHIKGIKRSNWENKEFNFTTKRESAKARKGD